MDTFKKRVLPLKNRLYRLAIGIVANGDLATDVVQEVLIKVWEKQLDLEKINNLDGYCIRMTRNLAIDKIRSRHHQTTNLASIQHFVATTNTPHQQTETNDTFRLVRELIHQLPPDQERVMKLRDLDGLAYQEIAEVTGLSLSQVKVYLSRARKKIRTALLNLGAYEKYR